MSDQMRQSTITIAKSEIAKIPYVDVESLGDRTLTTLTFWFDHEWKMWIPSPKGLHPIKGEPVEADYFGKCRESESDVHIAFLDFMAQRACWSDALRPVEGLLCDIHNLGASLAKINMFYEVSKTRRHETTKFVSTELEYIFGVCRSIFDLLQKTIVALWGRVKLCDETLIKKNLPDSFRKMVMKEETRVSAAEISSRWCIPVQLAEYYHKQAVFFEMLRSYRDNISHHGKDVRFLYVTERGFAIQADTQPFASFSVWNEEHMLPNRLASLRPVLSYIILETIRACEEFTQVMQRIVQFPPPVAPGFTLFCRGHHTKELLKLPVILEKCLWWDQDTI